MKQSSLVAALTACAALVTAGCTELSPKAPAPLRVSEGLQGRNPVYHTEVRPGFWVHGRPGKPIVSGSFLIIPEAYDFVPAQGGQR